MNVLVQDFKTPLRSVPFDQINYEDYLPAFRLLIQKAETAIAQITKSEEEPTFKNTIEALAYSSQQLDTVANILFNLNSADTNEKIDELAEKATPLLTEHSANVFQNDDLFIRIKKVYGDKEKYHLNEEQKTLLEDTYKGFVRSGAMLNEEGKKELKDIEKDLGVKSLEFGQNALGSINAYFKQITDIKKLRGIPQSVLELYAEEAKERGLDGWVITLQYPSYIPLMTYAEDRSLRQEIALAYGEKAFDGKTFDNRQLISDLINLRQKKARLLGYRTYADYVLEERMAKTPRKVMDFLNELLEKAKPYAESELRDLAVLARKDGIHEMQSFDHAFYAEKLRKEIFDLNDEELKPYFPLHQVQLAIFVLANRLFGFTFEERPDIAIYNKDVKVFEVKEDKKFKALLYCDYFPRAGKRAGAWMTEFKGQYKKDGVDNRPHVSIVCNFNKPTKNQPSLLTFNEVKTLFHETGHALHGILANTEYPGLSGTSVKWDFVELPSQFLENYASEPEFLKTFAKHYETGELLPDEKIAKITESQNFMEGYQTVRQLGFAFLDMAYHSNPEQMLDVKRFEDAQLAKTRLYPVNPETAMSPTFTHIFHGGYAAGYYSYKWAEVLDADAFAYFKETGIFNPETAAKYRKMLEAGGTRDPMELYKEFRGREPKVESLLERAFGVEK